MSINEQTLKRLSIAELEKLLPILHEENKDLVNRIIENKKAGIRRGGFSDPEFARQAGEKGRQSRYASKEASKGEKSVKSQ